MKILISYHNKEGYENIIPVANYLKNKNFSVKLLDLCSFYIQDSNNLDSFEKVKINLVFKDRSNYRNLSKIRKIIFYIQLITLNYKLLSSYDCYLFSPGGFIEGQIAKKFKNKKKHTFFIEGGLRAVLFANYPDKPKSKIKDSFLNDISRHYVSGEENKKIILNNFQNITSKSEKIKCFGVPRYNNLVDRKNEYRYKEIKNVLYLTTAAEYHDYKILQEWHDSEMKILKSLIENSSYNYRIRVHPRDNLDKYKEFSVNNITSAKENSLYTDVSWCDIVVTIPSSTFFEINYFGKPFLILWPFDYNTEVFHPDITSIESLEKKLNKLDKKELTNKFKKQKTYSDSFVNPKSSEASKLIAEDIISFF
tara:strand:+ start:257 stop:1351 length:1095 start_codon:yes stop_codon:yes gene_type:complete